MSRGRPVYVIGTSAPPIFEWPSALEELQRRGWQPHPALSATAAAWCDVDRFSTAAGVNVRVDPREPTDTDPWPPAQAVLAAPLTFNTINKWAGGHNDSLVLGLLNELMGEGIPIVVAPCAKRVLQKHPAYEASIQTLTSCGVRVLPQDEIVIKTDGRTSFVWTKVLDAIDDATGDRNSGD